MKNKRTHPVLRKILFGYFLVCLSPGVTAQAANGEATSIATVGLVEGDVRILDNQKKSRTVAVGNKLYEGESVVTGADGELHLTMEDEGFIAVRPNTRMQITEYRAQGDEQDRGVIALLTGSLRSVTGWIGKYRPQAYAIRTPTATIGIRGTDHEPMVIPEGSTEGEPGTYDKVNIGGSYIETADGRIDVPARRAAFAPHAGKRGAEFRPRLLDKPPRFYRRLRNEHLIDKRHAQIQRTVKQRREAKRRLIRDRLQRQGAATAQVRQRTQTQRMNPEARNLPRQQVREQRLQNRSERTEQRRQGRAAREE